ncbi:hypothetical protein AeRB84_008040 [Aphanomyces euteiches]|nr:hypothetical protein AeRB84_009583 [Aphanomyces euteiches]KAH9148713.1 hypothetical protein AeRB84_008040 [Aphanomyces euteiches]
MKSSEREQWKQAEPLQLEQLRQNGTWEMDNLPTGRKTIGTLWVYAKKTDAQGNNTRFKARLVANGFTQVQGTDFNDSFSPVVKASTIRTMMALSLKLMLKLSKPVQFPHSSRQNSTPV